MVRIQAAGDVVKAQRRLRAAVGADSHVAWVDVIDEAISRIHASSQEYVGVMARLEADEIVRLRLQNERLHAEVAALRRAADEVLSWNLNDTSALLSNPPQNAALFHAQRVLRDACRKGGD